MSLLLTGGQLVTAHDLYKADLAITGGKIDKIGQDLSKKNYDQVIDIDGKYIMPGMIDPHVHLNLPMRDTYSSDNFTTGTRAAAAAGITTIIDFATQMGDQLLSEAISDRKQEADPNVYVDYGLHGGITNWNVVKPEIKSIIHDGVSSFKMFMAYRNRGLYSPDGDIYEALEQTKQSGGMILVHAESADLLQLFLQKYDTPEMKQKHGIYAHVLSRPNIVEAEAIQRAITLADNTGGHLYIVHMSTGSGANHVKNGMARGVNVVAETCPQYLVLDDTIFRSNNGHYYATAPQVKSKEDNLRLWQGINQGEIQIIGTDSCTFTTKQKDQWDGDFTKLPLGLPGTELMPSLIHTYGVLDRQISLNQFVQILSTNAAKVYGLYPNKGSLLPGTTADITIFDPDLKFTVDHHKMETNADWNPYQGWSLQGKAVMTILRGKIIMDHGTITGNSGFGSFLKRNKSGNFL